VISNIGRSSVQIIKGKIPLILVAVLLLIGYFRDNNEYVTFAIFMIIVPIFAVFRYDGRIPIGYAIVLLISVAILTFLKEQNTADKLAIFSYWLLIVGTSCLLIELFRKNSAY
jgi:hypothetical protein